jgi:hypothetical protein
MHISLEEYLLGLVPAVLQLVIAAVILRRGLVRQFPIFTTYTVYQVAAIAITYVALALHVSSLHYAYTYYPLQMFSIGLTFVVIYEIFKIVLEPYDALRRIWRALFVIAMLVLFGMAAVWVLYGSGMPADRLTQSMNMLERSLTVAQAGLLLLLFVLSSSLGLAWRSYSFGLALGFGTFAIVDLVLWSLRTQYGDQFWKPQSILNGLAYNVMIFIWAFYVLQPKGIAQPIRVVPYNDIAKWNEKLEELLKRKAA